MRSDNGGENIDVAQAMLVVRETGRQSHIIGSSVHNLRIERLWKDRWAQFLCCFYELENCGLLNANDDHDLLALCYTFLPRINSQLNQYARAWNMHPLRTEGRYSFGPGVYYLLLNGKMKSVLA